MIQGDYSLPEHLELARERLIKLKRMLHQTEEQIAWLELYIAARTNASDKKKAAGLNRAQLRRNGGDSKLSA